MYIYILEVISNCIYIIDNDFNYFSFAIVRKINLILIESVKRYLELTIVK